VYIFGGKHNNAVNGISRHIKGILDIQTPWAFKGFIQDGFYFKPGVPFVAHVPLKAAVIGRGP
jgi:hypothetical protein